MIPNVKQFSPNHCIVYNDIGTWFISYDSTIVFKANYNSNMKKRIYLGDDWDYSRTTSKHRNNWMCESTQESRKKLQDGVYGTFDELQKELQEHNKRLDEDYIEILSTAIKITKNKSKARIIADFLADVLYRCNPNFKASTFLEASGFDDAD